MRNVCAGDRRLSELQTTGKKDKENDRSAFQAVCERASIINL